MFRFENPQYLYLLFSVPLIVALFWLNLRAGHRRMLRLGKSDYVERLLDGVSRVRVWVKFALLMLALALLIVALARPQLGMRQRTETVSGIEVVVAVDVSNSMMAQDVKPTRLDKAKIVVQSLCNRLKNDKVALVVFAGKAFVQMPMSADNVSINMSTDLLSTDMIADQGTCIAEALNYSSLCFSKQKKVSRAIVLITDGEDHEGGVEEVVKELKEKNVKVYVMGIGSTKGSPIQIGNDYMRDDEGQVVITRLNEQMCRDLATQIQGIYIHIDNTNSAQDQIVDELNQLQRSHLDTASYEDYRDLFPWLVGIALILLIIDIVMLRRKSHYFDNIDFVKSRKMLSLILLLTLTAPSLWAQSLSKVQTHKGNIAFDKKLDSLSIIHYKKALAIDSTNYKARYNLGNTYLRQGKGEEALQLYEQFSSMPYVSKLIKAAVYHNKGLLYYVDGKYDQAIEAYKESLRAYPKDDRTRYNLALAQFMKRKNPQSQPDQNNQNDKDNKEKQQQQQQQQQQNQDPTENPSQKKNEQKQDMSKQNAQQMLRAAEHKERQTKEKLRQVTPSTRNRKYNW